MTPEKTIKKDGFKGDLNKVIDGRSDTCAEWKSQKSQVTFTVKLWKQGPPSEEAIAGVRILARLEGKTVEICAGSNPDHPLSSPQCQRFSAGPGL